MKKDTRKMVLLSIFVASSMILSYVESTLPPLWPAVPGVKIGLANIVVLLTLYLFSWKEALLVSLVRVLAMTLVFGNFISFIYSLSGAVVSLLVMSLSKNTKIFSSLGVSISGALFHNAAQVAVAAILLDTAEIGYYMIVLGITGAIAGVLTGILAEILLSRIKA